MNKTLILILVLSLSLVLGGCAGETKEAVPEKSLAQEEILNKIEKPVPENAVPPVDLPSEQTAGSNNPNHAGTRSSTPLPSSEGVDVDLSSLSLTMIYGEVYNMTTYPEQYYGKTIKVKGVFNHYQDPATKEVYSTLIIYDEAACCMIGFGINFSDEANMEYPLDYPNINEEVTLIGEFQQGDIIEWANMVSYNLENATLIK